MICKNKIIFFLLAFSLSVANESYNHSFDFYSNNVNEINSNMSINPSSGKLEAMLFSAIIPGSGQYLINNQKGKAIVFITAEVLAWIGYFIYKNKADDFKTQYQNYGDEHWGFDTWCQNYYQWNGDDEESLLYQHLFSNGDEYVEISEGSHHIAFWDNQIFMQTNTDEFQDLYEFIDSDYMENNNVIIDKDHHFYEKIVKYNHFFAGWDDHDSIAIHQNEVDYLVPISPHKEKYRNLYNESVQNYRIKGHIMSFIFINHFTSMLDALVTRTKLSEDISVLYDYDPTISFHEAKLIIKLK